MYVTDYQGGLGIVNSYPKFWMRKCLEWWAELEMAKNNSHQQGAVLDRRLKRTRR
jgi:hypothetical protein